MGTLRHHRHRLSAAAAVVALLFFFTTLGCGLTGIVEEVEEARTPGPEPIRRRLVGPGSSPPTCRARCGRCFPCRPVRVVIQPGQSSPLEYYPEAWRCKCGNKLFMP